VLKSYVCIQEEVAELVFEAFEKRFGYLVLDLGWKFVVEVKFFNDKIVIIDESVLNELFERLIQLIWDLLVFVAIFKPQKPEVQLLHALVY
jgi:hypothetical protein